MFVIPTAADAADQSVIDTPPEVIAVDLDSPSGADSLTRTFEVTEPGTVTNIQITVDFRSSREDTCVAAGTPDDYLSSYADEIALTLIGPNLVAVPLVVTWGPANDATYTPVTGDAPQVQVTFTDSATDLVGTVNAGAPITGVFQPVSPLSDLYGQTAAGTWSLVMTDGDAGAAQCYYSATLTVTTDAVAPTPPAKIETAVQ